MIAKGTKVTIRYSCSLDDGRVVDNSLRHGDSVELIVGDPHMMGQISKTLSEMKVGDKRHVHIPSDVAFGDYDDDLIEAVSCESIPNWKSLPIGGYVTFSNPMGNIRVKVMKVENGSIYFDHNHELAGNDLNFDIELLRIYGDSGSNIQDEIEINGSCGCGCHELKHQLGGHARCGKYETNK